ncbi:MAG: hypothetical protein ACRENP_02145 [Longimicrobiales bacterium]
MFAKYSPVAAGLLVLLLPACATLSTYFDSRADQRLAVGIEAFQRGDYVTANEELGWVVERYGDEGIGRQALLAVAAVEMDPRNPQRRLALGAELIGSYLRLDEHPDWVMPAAQTLYLMSMEMVAAEERAAQAQAERQVVERLLEEVERDMPKSPDPSATLPARLRAMKEDRDRLVRKVETLETQLAERDKKLGETEKELERIRKTLKS